jgi:GNAT superfamily N-acetyltransferase
MQIREAQVADIARMSEVRLAVRENVLNTPGLVTYHHYVDYITRRGKGWVAETGGLLAGFGIVDLQGHSIWALFVHPDFDRQGVGRALHDTMLNWYFGQTPVPVWLSTVPGTRAEGFYRRAGWRETGRASNGEIRFEMADWLVTD